MKNKLRLNLLLLLSLCFSLAALDGCKKTHGSSGGNDVPSEDNTDTSEDITPTATEIPSEDDDYTYEIDKFEYVFNQNTTIEINEKYTFPTKLSIVELKDIDKASLQYENQDDEQANKKFDNSLAFIFQNDDGERSIVIENGYSIIPNDLFLGYTGIRLTSPNELLIKPEERKALFKAVGSEVVPDTFIFDTHISNIAKSYNPNTGKPTLGNDIENSFFCTNTDGNNDPHFIASTNKLSNEDTDTYFHLKETDLSKSNPIVSNSDTMHYCREYSNSKSDGIVHRFTKGGAFRLVITKTNKTDKSSEQKTFYIGEPPSSVEPDDEVFTNDATAAKKAILAFMPVFNLFSTY